jgi:hypothetical protein
VGDPELLQGGDQRRAVESPHPPRTGGLARRQGVDAVLSHRHAAVDEHDTVGELLQVAQQVAADDDGRAPAGQPAQQLAQLDPTARVEARRRLVEQQHLRVVHERASQAQPLLLPARERVHRPVGVLGQAGELDQLRRPPGRARTPQPVGLAHELQVLPAGQRVVEAEDVGRPAHPRAHGVGLGDRVEPGHPHLAGVGDEQRGQHQQQRRLARPVGSDQRRHLARRRREVDAAHRLDRAERAPHPAGHHPAARVPQPLRAARCVVHPRNLGPHDHPRR